MNQLITEILNYVKKQYGTNPDYPWKKNPESQVLRHEDTQKWYALIMSVKPEKLGLHGSDIIDILNLKCDPMLAETLRKQNGIFPAYHMNHAEWITIALDGSVPMNTILDQIDMSYRLTASKKKREKIRGPVEWIVPANPKYYDIEHAFDAHDVIDWKQSSSVRAGDTVFLYVAAPVSAILYKCQAIEVNIPYEYQSRELNISKVMKLKLIHKYEKDRFTFAVLKNFGVYAVRGPRKAPESLSYELNLP